jgi:hypothetical protein
VSNLRRELIRLANRERLNSTEVESLLEFAEGMSAFYVDEDDLTATALLDVWKESFDAEP